MRDFRGPLAFTLGFHHLLITCIFTNNFWKSFKGSRRISSISITLECVKKKKKYKFFRPMKTFLIRKVVLELRKLCITKKVILLHGSLRIMVLECWYNLAVAIGEHCAFGYMVLTPLKYIIPTSMLPSTEMPFLFNTSATFIFV